MLPFSGISGFATSFPCELSSLYLVMNTMISSRKCKISPGDWRRKGGHGGGGVKPPCRARLLFCRIDFNKATVLLPA